MEGTMSMNIYKLWIPKTLWVGSIGLAATLLGWTPSCKAQEVNPALFTDKGVEDAYPIKKPLPKKAVKVPAASHASPAISNEATARKRIRRAARKQNVMSAPTV
jgi:hypothetical protein